MSSLYDRLEVSPTATKEEIINAGRKLSRKWHPDKNKDNKEEAEKKFKEIREALDVLSDDDKRRNYDQFGSTEERPNIDLSNVFNMFHNMSMGMGNMGMGNMGKQYTEPIVHHLRCTLEQIIKEESVPFTYSQCVLCYDCNGSGGKEVSVCNMCRGNGMCTTTIEIGPIRQQATMQCNHCKGKGKIVKTICQRCNGDTRINIIKSESIKLKNGLEDNMRLTVKNKGNMISQENYGDLIIHINVEPHEVFKREGPNLFVDIELDLHEALFGFTKLIYHLDGRILCVKYKGKTDYGTYRKIQREGFFNLNDPSKHGNLYIYFTFSLPYVNSVEEIKPSKTEEEIEQYLKDKEDKDYSYAFLEDIDKHELDKQSPKFSSKEEYKQEEPQPQCRQM